MTGLPLGVPAGVYSELFLAVAVLAAILEGLEELGVSTLRGVGAPLKGVFGSEGAGELLFIDWPRVISTPPLASDLGDTKYVSIPFGCHT